MYKLILTAIGGFVLGALSTRIAPSLIPPSPPAAPEIPSDEKKHQFAIYTSDSLFRDGYTLAYNRSTRNPYFVVETISHSNDPDSLPPSRSKSHFQEDSDIPLKYRAKLKDYIGSGFDRGHMVPAADMTTQNAMNETFLLSNISPQHFKMNRGYWSSLESHLRGLTSRFTHITIITGPLYLPKLEEDKKYYVKYQVLGDPPNVAVPTHFFKVVIAEGEKESEERKKGGYLLNRKRAVAGFVIPNEGVGKDTRLDKFLVPIDAIERSSGIEFTINESETVPLCETIECGILRRFSEISSGMEE
ncbi:nuclease [Nowakowskiella sp. JEL0407]|nr:nuclease [Nowakowskiella sp. JEL0407]